MGRVGRTPQIGISVLIVLLVLFGIGWKSLIAAAMITSMFVWLQKRSDPKAGSEFSRTPLTSLQETVIPELSQQLDISYNDSHQSINQITSLFVSLSELVKQRNALGSEVHGHEIEQLELKMNAAYKELMELLQHGDRNLQRQAGVIEGLALINKQLGLLEQEGADWDEAWVMNELVKIKSRTEHAMSEKSAASAQDEGVTYF